MGFPGSVTGLYKLADVSDPGGRHLLDLPVDLQMPIACLHHNGVGFHYIILSRLNPFTLAHFGSSVSLSTLDSFVT